jgi:hypothetical protein
MIVIGAKIWPTCTTKDAERRIIRFGVEQPFKRSFKVNNLARHTINEESSGRKGFIPEFSRHVCMS